MTTEIIFRLSPTVCSYRKSTFDIFNFLASQHRQLPDIGPYDDEEDEVLLKSTRLGLTIVLFDYISESQNETLLPVDLETRNGACVLTLGFWNS